VDSYRNHIFEKLISGDEAPVLTLMPSVDKSLVANDEAGRLAAQ
jgi:hypothetical protein